MSKIEKSHSQMSYTAVLEDDEQENSTYSQESSPQIPPNHRFWTIRVVTALNVILFLASLTALYHASNTVGTQNWALQQVSFYSPLFDRLRIPFIEKVVEGALFNENDILLRAAPSPEVDEAWAKLTDVGVVVITNEEVSKLGKDPKKTVKVPISWGYGTDAHLAQPDGQHALHCLNAVRKYAYREHYYPLQNTSPSNANSSSPLQPFHQAHLSHCLHILLQTLTCDFSTDMITHNWMATQEFPFPDFAINKKCKDHGKILEWQEKARISMEMWVEISEMGPGKETGEVVMELPPKLKAWSQRDDIDRSTEGGH